MDNDFDKDELMSAFSTALIDLWTDACRVFPNDKDIKCACLAIKTAVTLTPELSYETFRTGVYKYRDFIADEDEGFFLEKGYEEDVKNPIILKKIEEMRSVLARLSGANKTKVFAHLQGLCELVSLIEKQDINK